MRKDVEEAIPGVEISKRKESGKLKGTASEEAGNTTPSKPKKQVRAPHLGLAALPQAAKRASS